MRKSVAILIAVSASFAVIVQLYLMLQNRSSTVLETMVRFLSFFTILTNIIVAVYFFAKAAKSQFARNRGMLTAVTVYIFIVGLVYQILLRHIWDPTGMQQVVDELLHTINPVLVVLYWSMYEKKWQLRYNMTFKWMIYPVAYFVLINVRGVVSGYYPYPFIDVTQIGWTKALINSALLTLFFFVVACMFIAIGRKTSHQIKYR